MSLVNSGLKRILVAFLCLKVSLTGIIFSQIPEFYNHSGDTSIQDKVEPIEILKHYFASNGFKTGIIKIPELYVEVMLEENQFYKKEKNVIDVYERINEIRSQFGLPIPYTDYAKGYGWCGVLNAECSGEKAYGYVVLIKKNLNNASRTYTNGHENGHFLWYIGKREIIYRKFKNPDYVKSQIHTDRDFAILCGWIAMKIEDYYLNDCFIINSKNPELEKKSDYLKNLVRDYLLDKEDSARSYKS